MSYPRANHPVLRTSTLRRISEWTYTMPLGDLVGEALISSLRFAGRVAFEFIIELALEGVGRAVYKTFSRGSEPGPPLSIATGIAVWGVIVIAGIVVYGLVASP